MGWGYRVPQFNLWCRVYQASMAGPTAEPTWSGPRYSPCQIRGDRSNSILMELLLPKGTGVRDRSMTPLAVGDRFQVAGWEYMWATINAVRDVGAGFPNEYRACQFFWPSDGTWDSSQGYFVPVVFADLEPPEGAEMLGSTPAADFWQAPQFLPE